MTRSPRVLGGVILWFVAVLASMATGAPSGPASGMAREQMEEEESQDSPSRFSVEVIPQRGWATPGGDLVIAVVITHREGWHTWPRAPLAGESDPLPAEIAEFAIRTQIVLGGEKPSWLGAVGVTQYPEAHLADVSDVTGRAKTSKVLTYGGRAVAFIPLLIASGAEPGERSIEVRVSAQACNREMCVAPEDVTASASVRVVRLEDAPGLSGGAQRDELFASFEATRLADLRAGKTVEAAAGPAPVLFDVFGWKFTIDPTGAGLVLLLLVAFAGGVILNLTPCVLPVIPLKVMSLAQSAGNTGRCLYLGTVMSVGVVCFWLALGVLILTISGFTAISSLFAYPVVILGIGGFIGLMALGMFGLFTVSLPQSVYLLNPKQESTPGSFMFGVLTAVLSTPCTAPLMGTAAAWAAQTKSPALVLAVFGAIGAGMASPYFILAANPGWISKVPSTGPASELVKQVMGGLMVAVAVFFIGTGIGGLVKDARAVDTAMWWTIGVTAMLTAGWMVARGFSITRIAGRRVLVAVLGVLLAAVPLGVAYNLTRPDPIPWREYGEEEFRKLLGEGNVVAIDFTANWCLNCKALEQTVLHQGDVVRALNAPGVVAVKADLTSKQAPGWAKLHELKEVGIPLLAVVRAKEGSPGGEVVFKSNAYTPLQVVEAIERARGESSVR